MPSPVLRNRNPYLAYATKASYLTKRRNRKTHRRMKTLCTTLSVAVKGPVS